MTNARRISGICVLLFVGVMLLGVPIGGQDGKPTNDIVVTAEGLAACTAGVPASACRHAALADALRRAVENAVGTLVEARTHTRDFRTVEDTIRTTSEGFVRDYRILDERNDNGTYHVRIEARVATGKPARSLKQICRRLKDDVNPLFRVSVEDSVARTLLANQLSALGLRVASGPPGKDVVSIIGRVAVESLGRPVAGTKLYSANASTAISVADASGIGLPSVAVSLGQPVVGISQAEANRKAVESVAKLWVERNVPLFAAALLDDEGTTEPARDVPADDTPANKASADNVPASDAPAVQPAEDIGTDTVQPAIEPIMIPSDGPRSIIKPAEMARLADKLRTSVREKAEFDKLPVDITIARFKGIGMSDRALVEDILEDLSTALAKTGVFELVERSQLDRVLEELRIQNSGLVDSAMAKKLGKLVGARAVLVGSISDRKDCYVINVRLINTESGRVRIAESVVIDKDIPPEPVILRG